MIAGVIFLVGSALVAVLWGVLGMILYSVAGERGLNAVSETAFGYALGSALLLIPVFAGAAKLSHIVARKPHRHCLVFGFVALGLITLPALMSGQWSVTWQTTPYYVAIVPTALLGGFVGTRFGRG